jgi:hypothetical protein
VLACCVHIDAVVPSSLLLLAGRRAADDCVALAAAAFYPQAASHLFRPATYFAWQARSCVCMMSNCVVLRLVVLCRAIVFMSVCFTGTVFSLHKAGTDSLAVGTITPILAYSILRTVTVQVHHAESL